MFLLYAGAVESVECHLALGLLPQRAGVEDEVPTCAVQVVAPRATVAEGIVGEGDLAFINESVVMMTPLPEPIERNVVFLAHMHCPALRDGIRHPVLSVFIARLLASAQLMKSREIDLRPMTAFSIHPGTLSYVDVIALRKP